MRGSLPGGVQRFEKSNQRGCLRRTQVITVGRHVPAALNHLTDELIFGEPDGNAVESRASLPATFPNGMAVAALLGLKNERTLSLKRGCPMQNFFRHGIAAPRVHVRTPGRESPQLSEGST